MTPASTGPTGAAELGALWGGAELVEPSLCRASWTPAPARPRTSATWVQRLRRSRWTRLEPDCSGCDVTGPSPCRGSAPRGVAGALPWGAAVVGRLGVAPGFGRDRGPSGPFRLLI